MSDKDPIELYLIAAMAENRVIGRGLEIPWKIPGEQKRFRQLTVGHSIIMGRRTYESIGRPLPKRGNIVLTRQAQFDAPGCHVVTTFDAALAEARAYSPKIYIAGGAEIYRMAMPQADGIYLTTIHRPIDGDVFFPELPSGEFHEESSEYIDGPDPYSFAFLKRTP